MPDQSTLRDYLKQSVQFEMDYFVEKWQWIIYKIADKEYTKLDAFGEILQHKEESVDAMAKESLDIDMFLWLLFDKK